MTLKLAQFCDDPQKLSIKSSYPQKIFIFLKKTKNIEIQNFEPKKNSPSLRICENIRVPPPPLGMSHTRHGHVYSPPPLFFGGGGWVLG